MLILTLLLLIFLFFVPTINVLCDATLTKSQNCYKCSLEDTKLCPELGTGAVGNKYKEEQYKAAGDRGEGWQDGTVNGWCVDTSYGLDNSKGGNLKPGGGGLDRLAAAVVAGARQRQRRARGARQQPLRARAQRLRHLSGPPGALGRLWRFPP